MLLSDKFLKPNQDDRYYMQPSQIFYGLWTPYGILTPIMIGPWPDGSIGITYNMQHGVTFTKAQKQKIEFQIFNKTNVNKR